MEKGQGQGQGHYSQEHNQPMNSNVNDDEGGTNSMRADEAAEEYALEAIVEHRTREIRSIRRYLVRYTTQLEQAEKELNDYESQLARLRAQKNNADQAKAVRNDDAAEETTDVVVQVQTDAAETNNNNNNNAVIGDTDDAAGSLGVGLVDNGAEYQTVTTDLSISDGSSEFDLDGNEFGGYYSRTYQRRRRQAANRPKLVIPDVAPTRSWQPIRSPARLRRHLDTVNFNEINIAETSQVQGAKRKLIAEEEEEEQESSIPVAEEEEYESLIPPLVDQDEEHESLIPLLADQDEEHESLIPPLADQDKEHESLIPLLVDQDEDKSLIPSLAYQDEEHDSSSLIPLIGKNSSAGSSVDYQRSRFVSSLHKRRMRTLTLNPVNDQFFVTSALDGEVRLWEAQYGRSRFDVSLLSVTDECLSPRKRRWAEDIAWHPNGSSLFSVHSADGQDSQVSIMHLTGGNNGEMREILVDFLEDKPHARGVINSIAFLPREDPAFVTAGTDHAVVIWRENGGENKWTAEPLHRNYHTAAVMGVAGMQHKQIVLSAGKDRRIVGYDVAAGTADYTHQVDSKCLGVVSNPIDFNLFVIQTGTPKRQLKLFDIRMKEGEIQDFGWKQRNSDTQSALIKPSWSSDGLFMASGSDDPLVHIFDIRYKGHKPSLSIEGHKKRVFKAAWLRSLPLLISISSDLNLGLHMFA